MMRIKIWARDAVASAPIVLLAGLAAFGVAAESLLLLSKFESMLVWSLGGVAALIAMIAAARLPRIERPGTPREQRWMDGLAIGAVFVWGVWNIALTSQHIFTNRDPATYANAAAWLVTHNSLHIATPDLFAGAHGFTNDSPGFETFGGDHSAVSAQGQHFYPALLAMAGRIVGEYQMLHAPILIGMVALLALYGFARLLVKPRWALLATVAFGVSLPMLYFSRDSYTEPLTLALLFSGMTLVWIAHASRRLAAWLLAGLAVGAAAMTRIDVYISIAGLVLFIAIAMAGLAKKERRSYAIHVLTFLGVVSALSVLAFVDMAHFSMPYLAFHRGLIKQEILGLGLVVAVSAVFVSLAWHTTLLATWRKRAGRWQHIGLALVVVVAGLLLASRPLWFTGHTAQQDANIAALQTREGLQVEPRSYTEQSVNWVAWYIGAPMALLGLIGLGFAAATAQKQRVLLLCGVCVVGITGLVYFVQPSVAPDQIWASRRYVPVVMPGLVVFAMIPLQYLWDTYARRMQFKRVIAVAVVGAVLLAPLMVSRPFIRQRDVAQAPAIKGVCDKLPSNAAVIWVGDGQYYLVQPTRSFCGVASFAYTSRTLDWKSIQKVADQARQAGYTPVVAIMKGDMPILGSMTHQVTDASNVTLKEMEMRLMGPPRYSQEKTFGVNIISL